jgi:MFS family permease
MLGSITPLGERGRGARWGLTVGAYILGSSAGGAVLGGVLGWLGALVLGDLAAPTGPGIHPLLLWLAGLFALAAAVDAGLLRARLPSVRRQVNEDWLLRYRGWVYGVAFGFQLGLGMVTIVSSAAVYLAFLGAFLSSSILTGALIGVGFGLLRALPLLGAARVRFPDQLGELDGRLSRWDRPARLVTLAGEGVLAVAATAAALA